MYRFRLVHAYDLLELTVGGALDLDRSRAMLAQLAEANAETGLDLLLDLRPAEDAGMSYRDVYALVDLLEEHPEAFGGKLALLDTNRPGFEKVQFFQASAAERGFEVRAFLDFEAAVRWLQRASHLSTEPPQDAPPSTPRR